MKRWALVVLLGGCGRVQQDGEALPEELTEETAVVQDPLRSEEEAAAGEAKKAADKDRPLVH